MHMKRPLLTPVARMTFSLVVWWQAWCVKLICEAESAHALSSLLPPVTLRPMPMTTHEKPPLPGRRALIKIVDVALC